MIIIDIYNDLESLQEELAKGKEQNLLLNIRDYLAGYQETHGTPKTEYSFAALISVMGQTTGRALLALFYIIVNIAPVTEVSKIRLNSMLLLIDNGII